MNPDIFLSDFGHIANAPEGIHRLREMIYSLAVTGALSQQRRGEGDGHSLLKEILAKKEALIAANSFKRSPKLENLRDTFNENPPKIPSTWAWSRLVDVGEISPKNEAEDDTLASFASMSAISEMHSSAVAAEDRPWGNIKKGYTHFVDGDVVLAKITPCFENGKAAVMSNLTNGLGAGTTELHVVRPIAGVIEPTYIYVFLRSPYFKIVGEGHMTGTAGQKRLPTEYFATRPFPLPPLAEQKRIVYKVDELMALCDQLEAQQQERERRFPVLSRTCHSRFTEAPTPANLNRIFDETGAVSPDDLRKTILTLAVQGKLVPQDTREESAPKLLEEIAAKREQMLTGGYPNPDEAKSQLRKQREQRLPDGLQELPVGWKWATLMQTSLLIADCHNKTAPYVSSGIRLIRTTNIRNGQLNLLEPKYVSETTYERWSARCKPEPGDILITREAPMGEVCIIPQGVILCMGQRMMLIRLVPGTVDANFLLYSLMDPALMQRVQDKPIGATVQHLRVGGVETLLVAVPPLAEQRRIVTKVDELMALVDQLEAQQQDRDKLAEGFAKACVASFTGTTQLERPEKMKAPKTELVSLVTLGEKPKPGAKAPLALLLIQAKGTLPAKSLWQQSGLTIDAFYQQLKTELAQGWIAPPAEAEMQVIEDQTGTARLANLSRQLSPVASIVESIASTLPPPIGPLASATASMVSGVIANLSANKIDKQLSSKPSKRGKS